MADVLRLRRQAARPVLASKSAPMSRRRNTLRESLMLLRM